MRPAVRTIFLVVSLSFVWVGCPEADESGAGCEPACESGEACLAGTCQALACSKDCGDGECIWGADGEMQCVEVDVCSAGAHDCDANATCTATDEGFECACNTGFVGPGTTCAPDPCDEAPCQNGGVCTAARDGSAGGFECSCAPGYVGDTCESAVDVCDPNPCQNGGTCTDGVDSFSCACAAGYVGDTCATDVDDCDPNPCQNGGTCTDGVDSFSCACAAGYVGDTCATDVDDCDPNPCQNGGTCTDGVDSFSCACAAEYVGDTCATDVDDCDPNPCQNGGTCTDGVDSFSCACAEGWLGAECSELDDSCESDADCDDADPATVDSCDGNTCVYEPVDCGDGDTCTTDGWDEALSACANEAIDCDDGDACTVDSCDATTGCKHKTMNCSDGNACTDDVCTDGVCSNPAVEPLDVVDDCDAVDNDCDGQTDEDTDGVCIRVNTTDDTSLLSGAPTCVDDSGNCSFRAALEFAEAVDANGLVPVVYVPAGTYDNDGTTWATTAPVEVRGASAKKVVFASDGTADPLLMISAERAELSGLSLVGVWGAATGLDYTGAELRIENVAFEGFGRGLDVDATAESMLSLHVASTSFYSVGGVDDLEGVGMRTLLGSATATIVFDDLDLEEVGTNSTEGGVLWLSSDGAVDLSVTNSRFYSVWTNASGFYLSVGSSAELTFEDNLFDDVYSQNNGGPVHVLGGTAETLGTLSMTRNIFYKCGSDHGSALTFEPSGTWTAAVDRSSMTRAVGVVGQIAIGGDATTDFTIRNTLIMANNANNGAGILVNNANATVTIQHSTLLYNHSPGGDGGLRLQSGTVTFGNSIVAGSSGAQLDFQVTGGTVTSLGGNFFGRAPDQLVLDESDFAGTEADPLELLVSGTSTPSDDFASYTLDASSPVFDGGIAANGLSEDLRGYARPTDGTGDGTPGYDIGALEFCAAASESDDVDGDGIPDLCDPSVAVTSCDPDPCLNGGVCGVSDGLAVCACADGFTGDWCETDIDECDGVWCANGGTCVDGVAGYTCECADGYTGDACETNIDDCEGSPCANGGTCVDGVASYTCECADGYVGDTCDYGLGEPISCGTGAECTGLCGPEAAGCGCATFADGDYCTATCSVDADCPTPAAATLVCSDDGFCVQEETGTGPVSCSEEADCAGQCGPDATGCTCSSTPDGDLCVPTCSTDADCPSPPGMTLTCSPMGTCVPEGGPGGP